MKHIVTACTVAAALATALPNPADAFSARNGARVNPVNAAIFEVVPRGSGRTSDIWCAASEYARRQLGAGWKTRVYVARGRDVSVTTGRRSSVQFTIDPQAAGISPIEGGLFKTGFTVGDSMSVSQADGLCEPVPIRF
ncbi:hypothetical protein TRL7639_02642 [Falsiruegeria litorea R37]|uniref:Uncharacterized protein n=1 Tax=Falsiruegeria litorea R37 TaxID=1200284 RepID=A0A1Y5SYH9_9RHOB|nr:hypothetical protein [Falsiruegeria litorea]SLN48090.1 hypothetical protein TRL7639_02642 [Falsiruegeria litorea R37]